MSRTASLSGMRKAAPPRYNLLPPCAFDEEKVAETIARERVTNGFFVPNMVRRMLARGWLGGVDMSSFRPDSAAVQRRMSRIRNTIAE